MKKILAVAIGILLVATEVGCSNQTSTPAPQETDSLLRESSRDEACIVNSAYEIGSGGAPGWSADGQFIVYHKWDSTNIYQVYVSLPDGSNTRCLTCETRANSPRVNRHKTNPTWDPSGAWIVMQVEMDSHPFAFLNTNKLLSELAVNGLWSDLYVTTPDGTVWHKLTDYTSDKTDGAMSPWFSADGTKLVWSRLTEAASSEHKFGKWKLLVADFVVVNGIPRLENIQDLTPSGASLVESHGFSPDGNYILFTSDIDNTHDWGMDIYTMRLSDRSITNLTQSVFWEEHSHYTASGRKIIYMSSEPYPKEFLKTELMIADAGGSDPQQLTHFNVKGYPEYTAEKSMPTRSAFSPDGSKLIANLQSGSRYPSSQIWVLEFAGNCGA